jgi:hypothetical protein
MDTPRVRGFYLLMIMIGLALTLPTQYMISSNTYEELTFWDGPVGGGHSVKVISLAPSWVYPVRYASFTVLLIGVLFYVRHRIHF